MLWAFVARTYHTRVLRALRDIALQFGDNLVYYQTETFENDIEGEVSELKKPEEHKQLIH